MHSQRVKQTDLNLPNILYFLREETSCNLKMFGLFICRVLNEKLPTIKCIAVGIITHRNC
jgi:hypothetical protein